MKKLGLLAALAIAACGGVSQKDAENLLEGLTAIGGADATMRPPLLAAMCSEIPSCAAGSCKEVFAALPTVAEEDRMTLVVQCAPEMRDAAVKKVDDPFGSWVRAYIDRYVQKARGALADVDQAKLDGAWAKARSVN